MAASDSLPQKSYRLQNSVRVVSGYGASIRVDRGHLVISDRGMAGTDESRLERIGHGLRRLCVISPDWWITGAALEWLTHQDASLVVLERDGELFCATGRQGTSEAKLRRAQACLPEAVALRLSKTLVDRKVEAQALGLYSLLGVFHVDRGYRDSLAFDVMEPCRPQVEAFLLELMTREPLERRMFFEKQDGCVRLSAEMCRRLSETAPLWARAVAPVAEWLAEEIWKTIPAGKVRKPSTRLTQSTRRDAKQQNGNRAG